ncbi:hypothetical protein [Butyrivibrio sp. MC2021]|uniref:hypothetical protein n=1 Tax=Butyrivibrio sp. MC2021 TaxID=1408306 RepID=UPI00047B08B1|nr:hypothetical protein [Butyrivibrio sp. MC2021]
MSRFEDKDAFSIRISDSAYRILSLFIFTIVAVLFFIAVDETGKVNVRKQQESLESALSRDIVQCYAIEGRYPPSLEYMEEHYGLVYDKEIFFVDYQPIGANLYPDVTVISIGGEG